MSRDSDNGAIFAAAIAVFILTVILTGLLLIIRYAAGIHSKHPMSLGTLFFIDTAAGCLVLLALAVGGEAGWYLAGVAFTGWLIGLAVADVVLDDLESREPDEMSLDEVLEDSFSSAPVGTETTTNEGWW